LFGIGKLSFIDELLDTNEREVKMKTKKAIYKASRAIQGIELIFSKVVYGQDDKCEVALALDVFNINNKTKVRGPFWLVKPGHLGKTFEQMSQKRNRPEGEYVDAVLESLTEPFDRRKVPGGPDNEPWYTDKQERYNYRVLVGTMTLHGIRKNDRASFLAETEKIKNAVEKIITYETFLDDFTLAAFLETSVKGEDIMDVKNRIIDEYDRDVHMMYKEEGSTFFQLIYKKHKREIQNFTKWDVILQHDVALDEIFLDEDAVDIGQRLYGLYCEKYKNVLMKHPDSKERGRNWIPRSQRVRN